MGMGVGVYEKAVFAWWTWGSVLYVFGCWQSIFFLNTGSNNFYKPILILIGFYERTPAATQCSLPVRDKPNLTGTVKLN